MKSVCTGGLEYITNLNLDILSALSIKYTLQFPDCFPEGKTTLPDK